ncbi:MAG: DUF4350 domain-containing protein [Taibaiella sp.]|nr:DUF4350 domain-containing protein [Taibaiella sp.]
MKQYRTLFILSAVLLGPATGCAQQQPVKDFVPAISHPLFEQGQGPILLVDGGHNNFHTADERFAPFAKVATSEGFVVKDIREEINAKQLEDAGILVIANALNEKNVDSWQQPVLPAFTPEEINHISNWVWNGGSLFLVADHMPFAGAAASLAERFGFTFHDGFALCKPKKKFDIFCYANGMLRHSQLTDTHRPLDSIVTFTGQAFTIPDSAISVITLDSAYKVLLPEVAWEFNNEMKIIPAEGMSQLAYTGFGKGKVVVAGEAAMFTAQRVGDNKIGLNSDFAPNNLQLLRNILEWLAE